MICMNCFKAYDIRGRVPDELDDDLAYRIGRAFVALLGARRVVVGRDIRLSSEGLASALSRGIRDGGADVYDIGLCGTEQVYFATFHGGFDGGIMVTASHNPMDYNGMKLVREGARPISGDSGLHRIRDLAAAGEFPPADKKGELVPYPCEKEYVDHLLSYVESGAVNPGRKIVVNAGNGCAGRIVDLLEERFPFTFLKVNHQPDGTFPNGIPNPLLPENRDSTAGAVVAAGADLGIAWDGDFDRCFLFDERGTFIEGYYIVGLLAEAMLRREPGGR
ncbi:MAG TPA: phosphomannomutase, partial [Verrucomicrobiae bacterium]|nr:phosphomannomutase [Verrucomicrobiae bacterium]